MAEAGFYESSYGDLRLFLSRLSTDRSRTQVVHQLSSGDDHVVQDRGRATVRARCSVLFAYMREDDLSPLERCRRLQAIVDDKPRIFRHPSSGSYLARIGPFTEEIESDSTITAEIEVIQVAPLQAVSAAGAGTIPATGEGAVTAAADALAIELADVGITSTLPEDAKASVDSWALSDKIEPRQVLTAVGALTAQLGALADVLEGDIELWSAWKATILLAESVRAAAEAATSDTAHTFVYRVGGAVALRAVLASVYPAEEADARYEQVMSLNDIASPAWLEPGTDLLLPLPSAAARSG